MNIILVIKAARMGKCEDLNFRGVSIDGPTNVESSEPDEFVWFAS
jgi:hypothetical protein